MAETDTRSFVSSSSSSDITVSCTKKERYDSGYLLSGACKQTCPWLILFFHFCRTRFFFRHIMFWIFWQFRVPPLGLLFRGHWLGGGYDLCIMQIILANDRHKGGRLTRSELRDFVDVDDLGLLLLASVDSLLTGLRFFDDELGFAVFSCCSSFFFFCSVLLSSFWARSRT